MTWGGGGGLYNTIPINAVFQQFGISLRFTWSKCGLPNLIRDLTTRRAQGAWGGEDNMKWLSDKSAIVSSRTLKNDILP